MKNKIKQIYHSKWFPRFFYKKPDGGKDSGVTAYFLIEWKNNISKAQKGESNNFYGKHFTEEMKEKQRLKKISKPVKAFNVITSEEIIFKSIADCWKQLDLKKSNIIAYLKGRYNGKTYKGWQFTYC